jgi:hypothetical protein
MRRRILAHAVLFIIALTLTGCAQTTALKHSEKVPPSLSGKRILLMPPDIELSELTMGGMLEPKADWTDLAQKHVGSALQREMERRKTALAQYQSPDQNPSKGDRHNQVIKLHEAVGNAILTHKYGGQLLQLPTKADKFDWSLGDGVNVLREDFRTDYGLFIFWRDSYASAGRKAMMVGMAALGVGIPLGRQVGFASLVDLRTGDIVWFNFQVRGTGDLREEKAALDSVQNLLADFPT